MEVREGLNARPDPDVIVDYRDDETVWVWVNEDTCIEMSRKDVQELLDGFDQA
jgi:hypothetical protein